MNLLKNFREYNYNLLIKENIFFFILSSLLFFLDRLSKVQIINNSDETPYYVNDYINFDLIWNIGVGFGLLSTSTSLFYNFVTTLIGVIIIILIYILITSSKIDKFIYSIIVGGALGNFYDRIVYKAVPDFIDLHYDNFHWFTFNVADIFITIGILIFILRSFFVKN